MSELKPCPFCGGEAQWYLTLPKQIMCENGHIFAGKFGYLGDSEELTAAWNSRTRAHDEVIAAMNALLNAPKGVVPKIAEPFYDVRFGLFTLARANALRASTGDKA